MHKSYHRPTMMVLKEVLKPRLAEEAAMSQQPITGGERSFGENFAVTNVTVLKDGLVNIPNNSSQFNLIPPVVPRLAEEAPMSVRNSIVRLAEEASNLEVTNVTVTEDHLLNNNSSQFSKIPDTSNIKQPILPSAPEKQRSITGGERSFCENFDVVQRLAEEAEKISVKNSMEIIEDAMPTGKNGEFPNVTLVENCH